MEKYKYQLIDGQGVVGEVQAETLDKALLQFPLLNAKVLYQFPFMAVIKCGSGQHLGVKWQKINCNCLGKFHDDDCPLRAS